jgi:hypothetical protein
MYKHSINFNDLWNLIMQYLQHAKHGIIYLCENRAWYPKTVCSLWILRQFEHKIAKTIHVQFELSAKISKIDGWLVVQNSKNNIKHFTRIKHSINTQIYRETNPLKRLSARSDGGAIKVSSWNTNKKTLSILVTQKTIPNYKFANHRLNKCSHETFCCSESRNNKFP